MRITSGKYKGRTLTPTKKEEAKPTKEMVKQAIFNIIGPQIKGFRVLDLYAGIGSLGFEAVSRGAKAVDFVEEGYYQAEAIKSTIKKLNCSNEAMIYEMTVGEFFEMGRQNFYHLIIADPPYSTREYHLILQYAAILLVESGVLVIESGKHQDFEKGKDLTLIESRTYGISKVTLWQK